MMQKTPSKFAKIFGSGPIGVFVSLVFFAITFQLNKKIGILKMSDDQRILTVIFVIMSLATAILIIWSIKSLPAKDRGNKLHTSGAYKYVQHPLYASFLSVFNFGLAIFMNSYLFILWAMVLHPLWHFIIRYEERLMVSIFKDEYSEYQKRTGRFFPKVFQKSIIVS